MDISLALRLFVLACAALAVIPAFVLENARSKRSAGGTRPYTWGYFLGSWGVIFGVAIFLPTIFLTTDPAVIFPLFIASLLYAVSGYFVIKRRKWAWVVLTILTLNPILWIAHYLYGRNRWHELGDPSHRTPPSANRPTSETTRQTFLAEHEVGESLHQTPTSLNPHSTEAPRQTFLTRLRNRVIRWHPGKIALLWFFPLLLLAVILSNARDDTGDRIVALIVWAILCAPFFWVTWTWLGARDKK
jgi:hypothetical protein